MNNILFSSVLFSLITLLYSIVNYFTSKDGKKSITKLLLSIYIVCVLVSQFFINLKSTQNICGTNQPTMAIMITLVPWVFVFGSLILLLNLFPGWKSPFSNTFGYILTKIMGIQKIFNNILVSDSKNKMLAKLYEDNSLMINEITPSNFEDFWQHFTKSNLLNKTANTYKNQLYNLVKMKDIVSETIWYLLSGNIILSISENYLTTMKCRKSVSTMKEQHEEWEEEKNKVEKEKSRKTYFVRD